MHFQIIKDKYFGIIVNELRKKIPEFYSLYFSEEEINPSFIIADFRNFMIDNKDDEIILNRCFDFISEAFSKGGYLTHDTILEEVFLEFFNSPQLNTKALSTLKEKALEKYKIELKKSQK